MNALVSSFRTWARDVLRRRWIVGAVRLLVVGLLLGWLYGWAAPRVYPRDSPMGFVFGVAHGALMPMALPALLLGQDVPIYAPRGTGRSYKIGYIAGINFCGLIFFGSAFWQPRRRPDADAASQNAQPR